jgi:hypothetical protein
MNYRKCIIRRILVGKDYTFSIVDYTNDMEVTSGKTPCLKEVGEREGYLVGKTKVNGYKMLSPEDCQAYVDNGGFVELVYHYDSKLKSLVPYYLNGKVIVKGDDTI